VGHLKSLSDEIGICLKGSGNLASFWENSVLCFTCFFFSLQEVPGPVFKLSLFFLTLLRNRVADPHSFYPDPDPAF
jgi:hypothetical protein